MTNKGLVPRRETVVGTPKHVAAALEAQSRAGRMVSGPDDAEIRQLDGGCVAVTVTMLMPPKPVKPTPRPQRREDTVTATILKALAFAGAVMTLFAVAAAVVLSMLTAKVLGVTAVVVIVAFFLMTRVNHSGACAGLHCDGCKG